MIVQNGMAKILVIDHKAKELAALQRELEREQHVVQGAMTTSAAERAVREVKPDLLLVDPTLPNTTGFELCRMLRALTSAPMIVITSSSDEVDKVVALELGADDVVSKPFSAKELLARVNAHLRRSRGTMTESESTFESGDLRLDLRQRKVTREGTTVELRPREFDLLSFLMQHMGTTFRRDQLLSRVWGYEGYAKTRTVDVHIGRLRDKIEADPDAPLRIVTVRGVGYRFDG